MKGKIVACIRGVNARVEKGAVVKRAGGVGLLLLNKPSDGNEILSDPHVLPASHLNAADSISVLEYINKSRYIASIPSHMLREAQSIRNIVQNSDSAQERVWAFSPHGKNMFLYLMI